MLARNGWKFSHGVKLLVAMLVSLAATWPAWQEIAWAALHNDVARSGLLVLPIMFWLIWVRCARFRFVKPGGWAVGLILVLAGVQMYYTGMYVYGLRSVYHLGAVLTVIGAVLLVTGHSVLKQFLPAWAILPLLVPIPATLLTLIAKPLQLLEAQFISVVYRLFGFSVQIIEGQASSVVVIGSSTLPIESVCKGLPTTLSLMLICYGFVFSSPMRPPVRVILLAITPFVALLCSAIALGGTLWLYGGESALVTAYYIRAMSQWVTLLIAFLMIAGSVRVLVWASVPVHQYQLASTSP